MTKRFKLKISRILSFKSCRSKSPSSLPFNPVPSSLLRTPSPVNCFSAVVTTMPQRRRSSFRLHVLTVFDCGCSSTPLDVVDPKTSSSLSPPKTPTFQLESEGNWHVIAQVTEEKNETPRRKIYDSGSQKDNRGRLKKKERSNSRRRVSISSAEEETDRESLLPSSTNLSPEYSFSELSRVTRRRRKPMKKSAIVEESESSSPPPSPARLSSFVQRLMPCTTTSDAVMVEGVAVVKRSEDPYKDFKGSMMEMIVEEKMYEVAELEHLLSCFISLNAKHHHRAIVRAFTEIWVALFAGGSGGRTSSFSSVQLSDYEEC